MSVYSDDWYMRRTRLSSVFWVVVPRFSYKFTDVPGILTASIIRTQRRSISTRLHGTKSHKSNPRRLENLRFQRIWNNTISETLAVVNMSMLAFWLAALWGYVGKERSGKTCFLHLQGGSTMSLRSGRTHFKSTRRYYQERPTSRYEIVGPWRT
jgi:hypothetical protein